MPAKPEERESANINAAAVIRAVGNHNLTRPKQKATTFDNASLIITVGVHAVLYKARAFSLFSPPTQQQQMHLFSPLSHAFVCVVCGV